MAKKSSRHPTELELEILKVLWDHDGPMRVREVRDALADVRGLAYTSVMTVMNIMTKKGFLKRVKSGNSYVYRAAIKREATSRKMLGDLVDRLYEGSASSALLQLLETSDLDDAERAQIRKLLESKEDAS